MKKIALVLVLAVVCFQFISCNKKIVELDFNSQLAKDKVTIDAYLSSHSIPAIKDSSGLRYVVNHLGTGIKPLPLGIVSVKYTGTILGGQIFEQNNGATFSLKGIIQGWQIALPMFPKGSKITLYLPSGLAYGHNGSPIVPGDANLIYDIQILDDDAQLIADVAAIDAYLDTIDAQDVHKDTSGLRYTFTGAPGTGLIATANSNVSVTYVGKLLSDKHVFGTQSTPVFVSIPNLIAGWSIALQLIPSGSQVTVYIPSGLGYGPGGTSDGIIPPNANLIFEIHVISVD